MMQVMVLGLRAINGVQGGIETHVRTIVTAIAAHDEEFHFEIIERKRYAKALSPAPNVTLTAIWSPRHPSLETIAHSLLGVAYAAIKRPDVLHLHGVGPSLVAPLARAAGLKVVTTHHGEDYNRQKWGAIAKCALVLGEVLAMRFSNRCIAVAPGLAERLQRKYRRDVTYIPNPIPNLLPPTDDSILAEFGLKPKSYFLHVGRMVPEKRQLELIEAYQTMPPTDWPLVLVGSADRQSEYSQKVLQVAKQVPNALFLGTQHGSRLSTLFAQAGGFILPSSHEGLPIALLEAMKFGLPIAVSDIQNLLDLKLPAECYFAPSSRETLSSALFDLRAKTANTVDWSGFLQNFELNQIRDQNILIYKTVFKAETDANNRIS